MPIAREDGFYQSHDLAHVSCLGIESERLDACVAKVRQDRVRGVFGSPTFGFHGSDLDFLNQLDWVEAVWFFGVDLKNIDGLYALKGLRRFGIHPKRPPIDFSRFSKLSSAVIMEPKAKDSGLAQLRELEMLSVWRYKSKDDTFTALGIPQSVVHLIINWVGFTSLKSLPSLPKLKKLEVHRCRNLKDLGPLAEKFPKLEELMVGACGRVTRAEGRRAIEGLRELKDAYIDNKELREADGDSADSRPVAPSIAPARRKSASAWNGRIQSAPPYGTLFAMPLPDGSWAAIMLARHNGERSPKPCFRVLDWLGSALPTREQLQAVASDFVRLDSNIGPIDEIQFMSEVRENPIQRLVRTDIVLPLPAEPPGASMSAVYNALAEDVWLALTPKKVG